MLKQKVKLSVIVPTPHGNRRRPIPRVHLSHHHLLLRIQEGTFLCVCVCEKDLKRPRESNINDFCGISPPYNHRLTSSCSDLWEHGTAKRASIAQCTVLLYQNSILQEVHSHGSTKEKSEDPIVNILRIRAGPDDRFRNRIHFWSGNASMYL